MENGIQGNLCEEPTGCTDTRSCAWHMHVPIAHIYIPTLPPDICSHCTHLHPHPPPTPPRKKSCIKLNPDHANTGRSQLWILSLYLTHNNCNCHHKPHEYLFTVDFDSIASTNNVCIITLNFVFLSNRLSFKWTTDSRATSRWHLPPMPTRPGYCNPHYHTLWCCQCDLLQWETVCVCGLPCVWWGLPA